MQTGHEQEKRSAPEASNDHGGGGGGDRTGAGQPLSPTLPATTDAIAGRGHDTLESASAGAVIGSAQANSSGQALEAGARGEMEQKFGQAFGEVRVHTDGAAADATSALNANAVTAGNDIFFGAGKYDPGSEGGKHLLAHELTHVVQGGGAAAKGTGEGPTVSSPGDAHETKADAVASAVVSNQPLPSIQRGGAQVSFDRMGDLQSAADGNWLGMTSGEEVLRRVGALSPEEKRQLGRDQSEALVRKIVRALNPMQMTTYFSIISYDLRWKIYWLNQGGHVDSLSMEQWRWVVGYAGPAEMAELRRSFPAGYRMFMSQCPDDLLPPFDKLEGLAQGVWHGNAGAIRTAVASLSAAQKEVVKYRADMMNAIMRGCGNHEEAFRTITYFGFQLHQAVHWLHHTGHLTHLTRPQWGQLLAEAPKYQFDALVAASDLWAAVQAACDPALIQTVRQQTNDPTQAGRSLDDQVQADALFSSLGPAGFLALATQTDAAANYGKCKARNKVTPVLDGLPRGNRLGAQAKLNLKKWWTESGETDLNILMKMFEVRFNVIVSGTGATNHTKTDKNGNITGQVGAWTVEGLQRAWNVCEPLPPAQVEGNARFTHMLHDTIGDNGNAYYRSRERSGEVVLGYGGAGDVASGATLGDMVGDASTAYWEYQRNPDGSYALDASGKRIPLRRIANVTIYGATVRHEIGHAVDNRLNVMDGGWKDQIAAGGWQSYGSYANFLTAIISDFADAQWNALSLLDQVRYRTVLLQCLNQTQSFQAAWTALYPGTTAPAAAFGPLRVFWSTQSWSPQRGGPWYHPEAQPTGASGRRYQRAYDDPSSLWSYVGATRDTKEVSRYQWRAPGEWFAEVYQVYYAEQETDPTGATPVGGFLRARDATAADMMSGIVDRGFSPQAVQGGQVPSAGVQPGGGGAA
jgi:hypothetical protein